MGHLCKMVSFNVLSSSLSEWNTMLAVDAENSAAGICQGVTAFLCSLFEPSCSARYRDKPHEPLPPRCARNATKNVSKIIK